jgi:pimeloyl-ACP methyl ester carboxylesterase
VQAALRHSGGAAVAITSGLNLQWLRGTKGVLSTQRPLVLLHGFSADLGSWRVLVSKLPGDFPVLGIDLPGHGKSPTLPATVSANDIWDNMAAQVLSRLQQEGVSDFDLMGHSMGGGVALALAQRLMQQGLDTLRSLTLVAPAGLGPEINQSFIDGITRARSEPAWRAWLSVAVADSGLLTPSFIATAMQQWRDDARRENLTAMVPKLFPDGSQGAFLRSVLNQLRMPVKVLWGSLDRVVPCTHANQLPAHVALHRFDAKGHLLHVESADLLAQLVAQQVR